MSNEEILELFDEKFKEIGIHEFREFRSDITYGGDNINWEAAVFLPEDILGNDEESKKLRKFIKDSCDDDDFENLLKNIPDNVKLVFTYNDGEISMEIFNSEESLLIYSYLHVALKKYFNEIYAEVFIQEERL